MNSFSALPIALHYFQRRLSVSALLLIQSSLGYLGILYAISIRLGNYNPILNTIVEVFLSPDYLFLASAGYLIFSLFWVILTSRNDLASFVVMGARPFAILRFYFYVLLIFHLPAFSLQVWILSQKIPADTVAFWKTVGVSFGLGFVVSYLALIPHAVVLTHSTPFNTLRKKI
jgi:hypothetical protein